MILVCLVVAGGAAAQDSANLHILSEQVANTDDGFVSLDFVVRDARGAGVRDLVPGSISLSEPADQITLTSEPRLNIALAFVVDLSFGSADDLIRQTLRAYINTYYRDRDDLTLYILDGTAPRTVPIESREQALDVVNGLRDANNFFRLGDTLNTVFNDMDAKGYVPSRPRHVVYIGSFLTAPSEVDLSSRFREIGVPFHVVQAHTRRPTTVLEQFAENGGGLYVDNDAGALVLNDGQNSPVNQLKLLYDTIDTSRLVYTLRYHSLNTSLDPFREVTLTVALPGDVQASDTFSYAWDFSPPDVRFTDLNQLQAVRVPFRPGGTGALDFDNDTRTITIAVTFPDGVVRPLESVRLEIVQMATEELQQSTLQPTELNENGQLALTWSLADYATPDTTTPVNISVTVEDALGYAVTIAQPGEVVVAQAPPLPTPTTASTIVAAATQQLESGGVVGVAVGEGGMVAPMNGVGGVGMGTIFMLLLVIALLVLGLVFAISRVLRVYRLAQEDRLIPEPEPVVDEVVAAPVVPDDEPEDVPQVDEDKEAEEEPDPNEGVVAWLIITNGYEQIDGLTTRLIDMRDDDFIIGRAPDTDWQLNLPYISPRHCRIVFDNGEYYVRDMSSKNGTYINGERVDTGRAAQVPVGSEIWITKNIVLQLWDPQANLNPEEYVLKARGREENRERELVYRSLPGIQPAFETDSDGIGDEYSPI